MADTASEAFNPAKFITADAALAARIRKAAGIAYIGVAAPAAAELLALVKPGVERWQVKTGQDDDASKVGIVSGTQGRVIVDTTIDELNQVPRPASMPDIRKRYSTPRVAPVEITIWRVTAQITAVKNEDDGDLHLVLQGAGGETMVAEAPRPEKEFVGKDNHWLPALKHVRETIMPELRAALAGLSLVRASTGEYVPMEAFAASGLDQAALATAIDAKAALDAGLKFKAQIKPRKARLAGVGFFDRVHDQTGVAPKNGIELHPILDFEWLS